MFYIARMSKEKNKEPSFIDMPRVIRSFLRSISSIWVIVRSPPITIVISIIPPSII